MKIESQVISLELAKRLKELGVKQVSYFWWVNGLLGSEQMFDGVPKSEEEYAAFTVTELLELLPSELNKGGWEKWDNRFELATHAGKKWLARYYAGDAFDKGVVAKTPADACAGMLIDLIENNLLTV